MLNNQITQYTLSKNAALKNSDLENVHSALLEEYGRIAPVLSGLTKVSVVSVMFSDLLKFEAYFNRVDARAPLLDNPIFGVVVEYNGGYRLIDGYHRVKWAFENDWLKGDFILLSN